MYPAAPESKQGHFLELYNRSIAASNVATRFIDYPIHRVSIPHPTEQGRHITLPGRLYLPASSQKLRGRKTPLIVSVGGADTTQEELHEMHVSEGPQLGFAVFTFDGPGQGHVLRQDEVYMRPDYEEVIPGVLDWVTKWAGDNPKAKADIATRYAWGLAIGMFGIPSGAEALRNMKKYTFKLGEQQTIATKAHTHRETSKRASDYLARIQCPVLISGAVADKNSFAPMSATEALHRGLCHLADEDKEFSVAKTFADGGGQGKIGAWSLLHYRTYKFMDKKLNICREHVSSVTKEEKDHSSDLEGVM